MMHILTHTTNSFLNTSNSHIICIYIYIIWKSTLLQRGKPQLLSVFYFKTCFIHYVDFLSFMYVMTFYVLPNI
jgi:hypothetical protein